MSANTKESVARLLQEGRALLAAPRSTIQFTRNAQADRYLNDIENLPHLFVLGCIMDRQVRTDRAWLIPYSIGEAHGGFEFEKFRVITQKELIKWFERNKPHRFYKKMADQFFDAVQKIDQQYNGYVSRIWNNTPSSAAVIRRFLEFNGVGRKIATMAVNILVREFKIPMRDLTAIDISPDRRVTRYFKEIGLLRADAKPEELIYLARELSPEFPGLLDYGAFIAGEFKRT